MAGAAWLPPVDLTASGRPVLLAGEVERLFLSSIDLHPEENPSLPPLRSGLLTLTSHRLIWINDASRIAHSIPLNSVIHAFPPKKSLKNIFASPRIRIQVSADGDGKIIVDGKGVTSVVITIVMRGGKSDPEAFYGQLWEILRRREWAVEGAGEIRVRVGGSGEGTSGGRMAVVGVAGILRKEQEMWESTDRSLQDAFQDLKALMVIHVLKFLCIMTLKCYCLVIGLCGVIYGKFSIGLGFDMGSIQRHQQFCSSPVLCIH